MMKKHLYSLLSFMLFALVAWGQQKSISVEPGVSLELANYRKSIISNIQYILQFNIPTVKTEPIAATETIQFDAKSNSQPLQIDFKQDVSYIKRIKVSGEQVPVALQQEHLLIAPGAYRKGHNEIEINFIAGSQSLNRNDDFMYALFVPDHACSVFPCFDQPDLKARFRLTLTVPKGWRAMSNGAITDSIADADKTTFRFANSDILPTYLFSFTAGKYTAVSKMAGIHPADFFYRETDQQKIKLSTDSVFDQHGYAIDFLEKWTGIKYPFQKVGFAAIPDFQFGGMEHPGEVQYRASSLFLDDAATRNMRIARISLIAHETAHMWFGDMVTMRWFNDVWMKEVFANFMADKVTQKLMGTETFNLKFLQEHYTAAYNVDRTPGANPIRQRLDNLMDAGSMYGDIIYHKAPIMMRQLEMLMGTENFRAGVREYLRDYAYKNATWPDLISILSKHTKADLYAWNKVWVNDTGRPVINADVIYRGNRIEKFTIKQRLEKGQERVWPQTFEVTLVYADHELKLPVNLNAKEVSILNVKGLPKPLHIIYNSNGMGYGVFPVDKTLTYTELFKLKSPLQRASFYINAYENMLNKDAYTPIELLEMFESGLKTESEETNLRLLTGYISSIYWEFIPADVRNRHSGDLEHNLWEAMQQQTEANNKKLLFNAYQNVYLSNEAGQRVYGIWQTQKAPQGVKLTEDDYTGMALTIALKSDSVTSVLQQQLVRIKNPDRQKRLEFLMPALSVNVTERDTFFNSIKKREGRAKEAWVLTALSYLHHPLRQKTSVKYVPESLAMLEEIQATGDIFFPQSFIAATLGSYQSKEVAGMVNDYIKKHPRLNDKLLNKLLQGSDNLFRSVSLIQ
ncbi:aminopeptidase [Mucilaginibacter sp. MD40]|uniref:M1 family metallopeptidase n=1 Tax=Mucilaginibacter sp. MD40 TaxID=2029590 RepID=UPI000BAC8D0D|nr:M1 family aminopeptidase [Mucilaginibacter sp. MD40]PAW95016.1 aminopeptidase [Mucilaginibacter sp. MD40]